MKKIVVVGDVMLDRYVDGRLSRGSQEAPIPILLCEDVRDCPGGAANVAANIVSLGERAFLVGAIGADDEGADLSVVLMHIDSDLIVCPNRQTTIKTRYCVAGQQIFRSDRETTSPVSYILEDRLEIAAINAMIDADALVISDYDKGTLGMTLLGTIMGEAIAKGIPIIVDAKNDYWRFNGATIIKQNQAELAKSMANGTVHEQAKALQKAVGCECVVTTLGASGMTLFLNGTHHRDISAHYREVADVVGAGDTVAAALAVELARGHGIVSAARFANAAASVVVGKHGTATVTREEAEAVLADHQRTQLQADNVDRSAVEG